MGQMSIANKQPDFSKWSPAAYDPAEGINLDGFFTPEELREFATSAQEHPFEMAETLFPERAPAHTMPVLKILEQYALRKAEAMSARISGRSDLALVLEAKAERLYEKLPEWARW